MALTDRGDRARAGKTGGQWGGKTIFKPNGKRKNLPFLKEDAICGWKKRFGKYLKDNSGGNNVNASATDRGLVYGDSKNTLFNYKDRMGCDR